MVSALDEEHRKLRLKLSHIVAIAAVVSLLLAAVAAVGLFSDSAVGGGVRLGTAYGEPDLELYVGDSMVAINEGIVSWEEILGHGGDSALGIPLPAATPVPDDPNQIASLTQDDAERLAGAGARILFVKHGNPPWLMYDGRHEFAKKEILLRRADGSLDHLFCLDGRLTDLFGNPHRVLVPIRVRARGGATGKLFTSEAGGGAGGRFDNFLHRVTPDWNFRSTDPPAELADELAERGLWTPP